MMGVANTGCRLDDQCTCTLERDEGGGGGLSVADGQAAARQGRVDADGCDIDRPALTVHAHQGPNMDSVMSRSC